MLSPEVALVIMIFVFGRIFSCDRPKECVLGDVRTYIAFSVDSIDIN
jgi:hypothetical protein